MTQQIRREITEQTFTPVHVLQTTLGVIGWCDAQQLAVAAIPFAGEIFNRHSLLKQGQFQIRADQDMQSITEFIRFHAVASRSHGIHGLPEIQR